MWYEESPSESACEPCANYLGDEKALNNAAVVASPSVSAPTASAPSLAGIDLPHNFYWAIPGKLIGMGCPTRRKHIENLVEHYKVTMVVNLRECGTNDKLFEGLPTRNVHFPIKSFGVPSLNQVQQFIRCVEDVLEPDPPKDKDKGRAEDAYDDDCPSECGHANKSENNERKDCKKKGTQASYIDAGRCNDCFGSSTKPRWKRLKRNRHGLEGNKEFVCDREISGEQDGIIISKSKKKKRNKSSEEENNIIEIPKTNDGDKVQLANLNTVAVNCRWGKGRTGTMICCYLVHKEGLSAHEAICKIRALSPCSIETKGQEEFIEEFYRLKMVKEGRESEYQRSLPHPYVPQHHNHRTNPTSAVSVSNATYGRHEPAASRAYAMRVASANNKVCFNNSLLLAKMYK